MTSYSAKMYALAARRRAQNTVEINKAISKAVPISPNKKAAVISKYLKQINKKVWTV
jgi:hypothetical protein